MHGLIWASESEIVFARRDTIARSWALHGMNKRPYIVDLSGGTSRFEFRN
jgi:hypothetical protein